MSFPKTLAAELESFGCSKVDQLRFELPVQGAAVRWQVSFRALGFSKNQIDGAARHRHDTSTDFGWSCLSSMAGERWAKAMLNQKDTEFSGGFAVGPLAGWRSDFMFPNTGLTQDQSATRVAHDVRTHVMPALGLISSTEALLHFLCEDEEPNPWYRSQCLTRFAEIACLAKILGKPESAYMHLAGKFRSFLEEQLTDIALEQYIFNVRSALQSDA